MRLSMPYNPLYYCLSDKRKGLSRKDETIKHTLAFFASRSPKVGGFVLGPAPDTIGFTSCFKRGFFAEVVAFFVALLEGAREGGR